MVRRARVKRLVIRGRIQRRVTYLTKVIPPQFNKYLQLFVAVPSIRINNLQNRVQKRANAFIIQTDLLPRLDITHDQIHPKYLTHFTFSRCKKRKCTLNGHCLCTHYRWGYVANQSRTKEYKKVIRKKFSSVTLLIYSHLKGEEFNHFDVKVTLKFKKVSLEE
jgi:hypothetical protein